jgi:hypothetical protein
MTEIGRRGFLGLLGATVAATAAQLELDPERALWVPGQKTIFLPPKTPRLATADEVQQFNDHTLDAVRYALDVARGDGFTRLHFAEGWRFVRAERSDAMGMHAIPMTPEGKMIVEAELGAKMEDWARVGVSQEHGISLEGARTKGNIMKDLTSIAARASRVRDRRIIGA